MRALVYCRVSTDAQERDGTSLDTQERAAVKVARESGYSVTETVRDTASGFTLERPGIEHVRRLLRAGAVDIVLAYAVDRLSRNQNHIGVLFDEVAQAGARLEFVTEDFEDTAIGRFILAARAFTAEVEREKIAERTMRGKAERARRGKLPQGTGKGMYGYAYDPSTGTRRIINEQATVVRRIFEAFVAGRACNGIANDLNRDGVPAFSGGRWYALTIRRLLKNEAFAGRTIYRRTRADRVRDVARGRWTRHRGFSTIHLAAHRQLRRTCTCSEAGSLAGSAVQGWSAMLRIEGATATTAARTAQAVRERLRAAQSTSASSVLRAR